ncbi:MAG: response regulator [Desulfobacteraceae bacterium]|jgi:PAS domain S-box-containing protein
MVSKQSLRFQFALLTFLATGLLIGLVLFTYAALSYRLFLTDYEQEIESRMEFVASSLETMIKKTDYMGMVNQANSLLVTQGVVGVTILDVNRNPLFKKGSTEGFFLRQPISHKREQIGVIQVAFTNVPIKKKVKSLYLLGLLIAGIGVPLAALLIWFISGRQLQDILALSREIQQLGDIDSENIELTGMERQDEIGHLARSLAERNDAIRESKKQEQLLYHAINQSHDSVVITDADGNIEYVNPAFSRITGYNRSEAIGRNPRILQSGKHPRKFYEVIWETLTKGETWKGLIINRRKNGEEYQEEATITPVIDRFGNTHHFVAMKRDVTQEVVLERKLARAEKMQAIGLMAGGVAHDLNNILSGIVSYPELLLLKLPEDSNLRKPLMAIHESGKRAATVVSDLLTVARGAAAAREVHDLNRMVREYLNSPECLNLKDFYPNISRQENLDAKEPFISCSQIHIQKCLMNLMTNAAEAIGDKGIIRVATSNRYLVPEKEGDQGLPEGEYIVLSVEDNGPGISDTDLEHIFEPFYTRKMMGRSGTGLGLTVVWNTVRDHGGRVKVESSGGGTVFQLCFPVVTGQDRRVVEDDDAMVNLNGNQEQILVVDDEPQLRDIAAQILKGLNYRVALVESGEQAVEFLKKQSVDLVLIDMLMEPGMNGRQTYQEIVRLHPGQKAIIVSGFSESHDVKVALSLGAKGILKKPYSIEQLGIAVKESLAGD